jgi:ribosomal protein L37AE/L43A
LLQEPAARLKLTPSMFVQAHASGNSTTASADHIFRCPRCGSWNLARGSGALTCHGCGRRWSTADGIYDFREPL